MLSFHNDENIKQKYLDRVKKHAELDNIIQGTGWYNGKGCAVGCTLENYDHSRYPIELGLPEWLARLEDGIFENLPLAEAKEWPAKFLAAIPVGVDVEIVRHQLAVRRLDRLIKIQENLLSNNIGELRLVISKTIAAIKTVKSCHEAEIGKNICEISFEEAAIAAKSAWVAARSIGIVAWEQEAIATAAWSAARSAAWSARSAAWSAESVKSVARSAAWSAESAAWSAKSARAVARSAWSARSAAWSAAWSAESVKSVARSAAWEQEAKDLLELLSNLKRG